MVGHRHCEGNPCWKPWCVLPKMCKGTGINIPWSNTKSCMPSEMQVMFHPKDIAFWNCVFIYFTLLGHSSQSLSSVPKRSLGTGLQALPWEEISMSFRKGHLTLELRVLICSMRKVYDQSLIIPIIFHQILYIHVFGNKTKDGADQLRFCLILCLSGRNVGFF